LAALSAFSDHFFIGLALIGIEVWGKDARDPIEDAAEQVKDKAE
jgi:hypothetical protein